MTPPKEHNRFLVIDKKQKSKVLCPIIQTNDLKEAGQSTREQTGNSIRKTMYQQKNLMQKSKKNLELKN